MNLQLLLDSFFGLSGASGPDIRITVINLAYLTASILFILGLKGLSHPRKAVRGNLIGAVGMLIAILAALVTRTCSATSTSLSAW
jgi:NAD/NADP transhydrogenase beta subunit